MRFGAEETEESDHFRGVYANFIKPALEDAGYECVRADEMAHPGAILTDLLNMIFHAEICVADFDDF